MDYLILQNQTLADAAKRKIEANYLRYRSDWQNSRGFGKSLKNLSGPDVDPTGKTDANLLDDAQLVMIGEKLGVPNYIDGFTTEYANAPVQRLIDSKFCILLPNPGALRDALLSGVPQPNNIETDPEDGSWFQIEEV